MYLPNLHSVALPVIGIIAIAVFGFSVANPNLGEWEAVGVGDGTVRKSVGEFLYRPSIVTFHLSLRVSEILPFLCSSTPLFATHL